MKVPEPRRLPSGAWFIQLRLGGVSVPVTASTAKECKRQAELIKAEHRAEKRSVTPREDLTPAQCIDRHIETRKNTLSPLTIRGYRIVQKHRFTGVMNKPLSEIKDWQAIVDAEARLCAGKTLKNAYLAIKTAVKSTTGEVLPSVRFGVQQPNSRPFLSADEIPAFVAEASKTKYAVPLLLGLSSMRISEIQALDWSAIPPHPDFIRVSGAVVFDEHNKYTHKAANKTASSTRNVPILIPELAAALERDRQPSGPVMPCSQNNLRIACRNICRRAGVTVVTLHGLRHSFASLAYHLQMPEQIAMEIGGWSDASTMRKIYTHIAQTDIARYQAAVGDFFKNANENANDISDPA